MIFHWATATNVGLLRGHNEDAVAPSDMGLERERLVIGVADGMGGHVAGEVASRIAIEAAIGAEGSPVERVEAANEAVLAKSRSEPKLRGMGTTLTLAIFDHEAVEIGHIGDSRAYLQRDDALRQLTTDHSLVAEMIAAGELGPEEAAVHPYRSVITRAIGLDEKLRIDRVTADLEAGDRVLLCTDGLTNMVDDDRVGEILDANSSPAKAVWALVDAANAAGGIDNVTVAVIDVARDEAA
jgi:protein phosphatase